MSKLKRLDLAVASITIISVQTFLSLKLYGNLTEQVQFMRDEIENLSVEGEFDFAKKTDVAKVSEKIDKISTQISQVGKQLSQLKSEFEQYPLQGLEDCDMSPYEEKNQMDLIDYE